MARTGRSGSDSTASARTTPGPSEGPAQEAPPLPANVAGDSVPVVEGATGDTEAAATAQPVPEEAPRLSEEEQAEADAAMEGTDVVRYKDAQHFEIRTISVADWRKVGVAEEAEPVTVHWHKGNKFMVPVADLDFLTRDQFEQFIRMDPRFEVVTVE